MSEDLTSGTEKQLGRLVLGLLASGPDPRNQKPRLFFGKLPENFPIDVPVPEKTRVLGTLVRNEQSIQIVLESDLVRDEIMDFYRTQLTNRNWIEPGDLAHHQMGGFASSRSIDPQNLLTFCLGEQGPSLAVIIASEGAVTGLQLYIQLNSEANPFVQQKFRLRHMKPGWDKVIPVLTPPADSRQEMMNGGGSGSHEISSSATLHSDLALDVLAKHYGEQLSKAGWIQSNEGMSAPTAWHTWKFSSEEHQPWKGLFFILKRPDTMQEHILFVRAERDKSESEEPFAGWLNSASDNKAEFRPG